MTTQTYTWGDQLYLAVKRRGGMKGASERLTAAIGSAAASRSTLQKLFAVAGPESLDKDQPWYACQVLVAIGEDPADWGIADPGVPPSMVDYLRLALAGEAPPPNGPTGLAVTDSDMKGSARRKKSATRANKVYCSIVSRDKVRSAA